MNRNDNFDRVLEAWLARQAPPQAPDQVLNAALERVQGESQRRGWLHRSREGTTMNLIVRTTAVAAVVVLAVLIGLQFSNLTDDDIGATPTPSPSPSTEPSASTAPSASVAPSAQPSAEQSAAAMVVRLFGGGEAGRVHLVTVMDDGRVITSDPGGVNPPLERRLTPAGVQLVRDELARTGLTETSAEYLPVPNPGAEPPAYGGAGPSLEVGSADGETVVVSWFLFGDTEEDYFQPQPEAEALEALAARLTTLETWLPADAWADASGAPHQPSAYLMTITLEPWGGTLEELPVEYTSVAWPMPAELVDFGEQTSPPPFEIRCGTVTASDGDAVVEALEAAGAEPGFEGGLAFRLGDRAGTLHITVSLVSTLVASEDSC